MSNSSDKIIDHLWIGDYVSAINEDFLMKNNIKLVVNCTKDLAIPKEYESMGIHSIRLPIHDINNKENNEIMKVMMDEVIETIHRYRRMGLNVLVHCFAGMSRSASTVACYLIKYYEHDYKLAILYIQNKRPITFRPKPNFEGFLKEFR